jgi:hypothetical protein
MNDHDDSADVGREHFEDGFGWSLTLRQHATSMSSDQESTELRNSVWEALENRATLRTSRYSNRSSGARPLHDRDHDGQDSVRLTRIVS